jgi:DNA-binding MarR family transcriptional regulator
MIDKYLEVVSLIERVQRNYFDFIQAKLELLASTDINTKEAFILLNVGYAKVTVNEVRNKLNYFGPHVSYLVRRLIENGYLLREHSLHDFRILNILLTAKGRTLYSRLTEMHERYIACPEAGSNPDLERTVWTLRQIEQFWIDQVLGS